jgi:putative molybdopterin biosynthesis protein
VTGRPSRSGPGRATGHLQVAAAVTAGLADAGIASEPAALAYGPAFVPLASQRVNLVILAAAAGSLKVRGLSATGSGAWLATISWNRVQRGSVGDAGSGGGGP